jgi:hypothetical protein
VQRVHGGAAVGAPRAAGRRGAVVAPQVARAALAVQVAAWEGHQVRRGRGSAACIARADRRVHFFSGRGDWRWWGTSLTSPPPLEEKKNP